MSAPPTLPARPPFVLRARLLTPLGDGGLRWEPDAALSVGADGRIVFAGPWPERTDPAPGGADRSARVDGPVPSAPRDPGPALDLRPGLLMPGFVDLHVHIPQVPSAGLGAGLHLLDWLERHVFPLEQGYDVPAAERLAPQVFRAMAAAGTTAVLGWGAIWAASLDATFRAAEEHGIRAVLGKVMMDRLSYDGRPDRRGTLELSLRESAELCERWHGAADGRLRYAFTPRFAVSCTADLLRESARLAGYYGVTWQSHLSEDRAELAAVRELFPEAIDYLDVYDRAGAIGPRAVLAHAIHLSEREVRRLAECGAAVAHCPESNLFLASGVMPLARYLDAGVRVGLGSDVAGSPDLSMPGVMRTGFYAQAARQALADDPLPVPGLTTWLRMATIEGARALGLGQVTGSLEAGKEADVILVDPARTLPPGAPDADDPEALLGRLVFRGQPGMVRGAWVRGRLLEGPDPRPTLEL